MELEQNVEQVREETYTPFLIHSDKETELRIVYQEDAIKLVRYEAEKVRHRIPLLIVYALVNRNRILDLDERSVVRNLSKIGFDVYMIDWGTPSSKERSLTIDYYVNVYIDRCVDVVRNLSQCNKISILGYCMGGTFSAIYTALHRDKVRNLITVAATIDTSKDSSLFASLARSLDVDQMVDTFGNIPPVFQYMFFAALTGQFLSSIFNQYIYEYRTENIDQQKLLSQFLNLGEWLLDTPPIPGEVFRQWVKDIYQKNLLIKNQLQVGENRVNLSEIDVPLLNVIGKYDHLVSPESGAALNNVISSSDKTLLSFSTDHLGLCTSSYSHREIWPKVAKWLTSRSSL